MALARCLLGPAPRETKVLTMPNFDMSTVVFAIIAIFVVWKLRSVLGTRNGAERPPIDPAAGPNAGRNGINGAQPMGQVVRLPTAATPVAAARSGVAPSDGGARWKGFAEPGSKLAAGPTPLLAKAG